MDSAISGTLTTVASAIGYVSIPCRRGGGEGQRTIVARVPETPQARQTASRACGSGRGRGQERCGRGAGKGRVGAGGWCGETRGCADAWAKAQGGP